MFSKCSHYHSGALIHSTLSRSVEHLSCMVAYREESDIFAHQRNVSTTWNTDVSFGEVQYFLPYNGSAMTPPRPGQHMIALIRLLPKNVVKVHGRFTIDGMYTLNLSGTTTQYIPVDSILRPVGLFNYKGHCYVLDKDAVFKTI